MIYQDIWINGQLDQKGKRDCASRYEVIKTFCNTLIQPFSVCDIGANMSYFGLRLIEDFDCTVMAWEFDHFEMRQKHIEKSGTKKLMLLNRKLSIEDLHILNSCCHFGLVLALSVMHHLPGNHDQWITEFRKLGNNVILELALSDSKRTAIRKGYKIPADGIILGYGESHLKQNFQRPIILLTK